MQFQMSISAVGAKSFLITEDGRSVWHVSGVSFLHCHSFLAFRFPAEQKDKHPANITSVWGPYRRTFVCVCVCVSRRASEANEEWLFSFLLVEVEIEKPLAFSFNRFGTQFDAGVASWLLVSSHFVHGLFYKRDQQKQQAKQHNIPVQLWCRCLFLSWHSFVSAPPRVSKGCMWTSLIGTSISAHHIVAWCVSVFLFFCGNQF